MGLYSTLVNKPWEHQGSDVGSFGEGLGPEKIAVRTFLAVVSVMFGLFITAYFIRMELDDWRPMPESQLLWINTLLLFMSSIVLQWTRVVLAQEQQTKVKAGLLLGGLLTMGFIFGQLLVWQEMTANGYFINSNPANAFFYVLTGIHGLHILGGLWVWTRATIRVWSGTDINKIKLSVELCTVYWHFLLLVWLVLFALLSYT